MYREAREEPDQVADEGLPDAEAIVQKLAVAARTKE
jgi:hypothetical protein